WAECTAAVAWAMATGSGVTAAVDCAWPLLPWFCPPPNWPSSEVVVVVVVVVVGGFLAVSSFCWAAARLALAVSRATWALAGSAAGSRFGGSCEFSVEPARIAPGRPYRRPGRAASPPPPFPGFSQTRPRPAGGNAPMLSKDLPSERKGQVPCADSRGSSPCPS